MAVAGKRQGNGVGQAHTSSCGVGLFLLRDTIPLQFNRRLRCPLAVSYDAAVGGSAEPSVIKEARAR
jgi:hypothetical protein